jgi:hypothetical protein
VRQKCPHQVSQLEWILAGVVNSVVTPSDRLLPQAAASASAGTVGTAPRRHDDGPSTLPKVDEDLLDY